MYYNSIKTTTQFVVVVIFILLISSQITVTFASTNATTISTAQTEATKKVATGGDIVGAIISIVQAFVFVIVGSTTLFCGPLVEKSVTVVQALLSSGYLDVIASLQSINKYTVYVSLEGLFYLFAGTFTMSFATLKSTGTRRVMKGMVAGYMVIDPLLSFVSGFLFASVGKCTGVGEPTIDFPKGKPIGCDENGYLIAFYCLKTFKWVVTLTCGFLGQAMHVFFLVFSSALTGSGLFVKALIDLIYAIWRLVDKESAEANMMLMQGLIVVLTYAFAILGFLTMTMASAHFLALRANKEAKEKGMEEKEVPKPKGIAKYILGFPPLRFALFLMFKMEDYVDAKMKGKKKDGKGKLPGKDGLKSIKTYDKALMKNALDKGVDQAKDQAKGKATELKKLGEDQVKAKQEELKNLVDEQAKKAVNKTKIVPENTVVENVEKAKEDAVENVEKTKEENVKEDTVVNATGTDENV